MRVPRLTPSTYRTVTVLALVALCVIVVTGAAVRLTDSGLGCPEWPNCEPGTLAPHGARGAHGWVEFVNRVITGVVSLAVILAVLGSLRRIPRRRDLIALSLGLVAGVVGQIILGRFTVTFDLAPPLVMGHFLLSLVLVATAVALHHRAAAPDDDAPADVVPGLRTAARWLVVAAAVVVTTGTVVTGTGPHGGDAEAPRLHLSVSEVARVHGVAVNVLVAATLLTLVLVHRRHASPAVVGRARALLAVELAQAAVGYTQYFTGVPELLVGVHVLGAVAVWVAVCRLAVLTVGGPASAADRRGPDRIAVAS